MKTPLGYCSNSALGWKQVSFQVSDSVKDCMERMNMSSFFRSLWDSVPEPRLMMLGFWFKSSWEQDGPGSLCTWPPHENTHTHTYPSDYTHPIKLHERTHCVTYSNSTCHTAYTLRTYYIHILIQHITYIFWFNTSHTPIQHARGGGGEYIKMIFLQAKTDNG